ncbi:MULTISPECIES: sugar dehydrogenase complex small subunit [Roseivirga]|uniref:sugar dehydrogenase complex small subunit n=1 Tax=Roseivirga TaxID=290180 RepID=UPI00257FAEF3|nr:MULTISPECIES: sugar dehydrogenase complex small subunit [Roseivirga]MEC7753505.1 sugar dehydrogenase complex small subunit [Bacteroidota bacterium]|tara:strand:- start:95 stop:520 length:426 start_codon:yes stop_codon:yes gene_type:complete
MDKHIPPRLDVFLDISTYLTGFPLIDLQSTGMAEVYFNTIVAHVNPQTIDQFYDACKSILKLKSTEAINEAIEKELIPNGNYAGLGQKIILMWYLGTWDGNVISAQSYTQSLVWEVAETHPPGAKQPGYNSWSEPPIKINC